MILVVLVISIILVCGVSLLLILHHQEDLKDNKKKITSTIEKYHYILENDKSTLYKKYFHLLEDETEEKEIVSLIAQLFIIDFYTLQGKEDKSDIGGVQFLYPSVQSNFILKAQNTIYKYISSMEKELPVVKKTQVNTLENYSLESFEKAYRLVVEIEYEKNFGYPTLVSVIIIKENDQFYIVEIDSIH